MLAEVALSAAAQEDEMLSNESFVLDALALATEVEDLPGESAGALLFGSLERPLASVLVEGGRVCWAAVPGHGARLVELLKNHGGAPLPEGQLESVFRRCRASGVPLGETLVAEGLVSAEALRSCLFRHTIESLGLVVEAGWPLAGYVPHRLRGYDPAFSFGVPDVVAGVFERRLGPSADAARAAPVGSALATLGAWGAMCLAAGPLAGAPVRTFGGVDCTTAELVDLGRWGVMQLASLEACHGRAVIACADRRRPSAVAIELQGCALIAVCPSGAVLVNVTSWLLTHGAGPVHA